MMLLPENVIFLNLSFEFESKLDVLVIFEIISTIKERIANKTGSASKSGSTNASSKVNATINDFSNIKFELKLLFPRNVLGTIFN